MIDFFNDSTTIGQILINYPMMESFMHIDDKNFEHYKDFKVSSQIVVEGSYCNYLHEQNMNFPVNIMEKSDFSILCAYQLMKANYIVNDEYSLPTSEVYEYELTQRNIFDKQVKNINNVFLYTLNSSIFIDADFLEETYILIKDAMNYIHAEMIL